MDQAATDKNTRQRLMQTILDLGGRAFNPEAADASQAQAQRDFDDFIQSTKTFGLIAALNILLRPGHAPPWLRPKLMGALALIPLRADGVRATLEFVFAVHPSSTVQVSEAAVPQKKGANITHEALAMASNLVSSPPASVTPEAWYPAISPQLLRLLDGGEGQELMKVASYIIGFGILGRKVSGAPGTAGWKCLAEPMLNTIRPPAKGHGNGASYDNDDIIDLSKEKVLVNNDFLATALRRLHALIISHPNPGLSKRLLCPLLLPLWTLSSWPNPQGPLNEQICAPATELLRIYLKLAASYHTLSMLVRNLDYVGGQDKQTPEWVFKETSQYSLQIIETRHLMGDSNGECYRASLQELDRRIPTLLELITSTFSDADISTVFSELLQKWLESSRSVKAGDIIIKQESNEQDPMVQLAETKILQAMMERFPENLASQPKHILSLASQVLVSSGDTPEDDEATAVALSLLNMAITAPGFQKSKVDPQVLKSIEASLEKLSKSPNPEVSQTATNLNLLLKYRDEIDSLANDSNTTTTAPTDRQIEDRKTYNLAISYIAQADSPPPVRSEGLNLISNLISSHSPILDIPGILVLMSSLMRDSEDYINLRVIKIFTILASNHPKSVTKELLDHYVDAKETEPVDSRLRFGEALLQVVERLGETFTGEVAQQVGDALLAVASRRGHRPKTERRQAKEARLREMKNREAEKQWDGPVPTLFEDDDENDEDMSAEEKARNEILAKIVEGWESKRGTEDVRVRASALSVLASAIETNVAGLGPTLVSTAVDLCVSILQIEKEMEKGILRRAAVLLVMSFVRTLDRAKQQRKRLGFGLTAQEVIARTMGYVAATDDDGLVRQHASDLIESLENWNMAGLVGQEQDEGQFGGGGGGLTRLAGLDVDPVRSVDVSRGGSGSGGGLRPRIEEIE